MIDIIYIWFWRQFIFYFLFSVFHIFSKCFQILMCMEKIWSLYTTHIYIREYLKLFSYMYIILLILGLEKGFDLYFCNFCLEKLFLWMIIFTVMVVLIRYRVKLICYQHSHSKCIFLFYKNQYVFKKGKRKIEITKYIKNFKC